MANRPVDLSQDHVCKINAKHTRADPFDYMLPKLVTYLNTIPRIKKKGYKIESAVACLWIVPIDHAADFAIVDENVCGIEVNMNEVVRFVVLIFVLYRKCLQGSKQFHRCGGIGS